MRRPTVLIAAAAILAAAPSCSSSPTAKEVDAGDVSGLRKIASAYGRATAKNGRPPGKPSDLQPFLPEGDDVDQLLVSPRDGQPYVIFWGVNPRTEQAGESPVVIGYEKVGKDGTRFVFHSLGVVSMTDAEFAKATFPPGRRPE
jgi:hypothetical protein